MPSFLTVSLDTTSPTIEIQSPSYSTRTLPLSVTVQGDELLDTTAEIYTIDSLGVRRNYNFTYQTTRFSSSIDLTSYPLGMITIYAKVRDTVFNYSALVSKQVNLVASSDAIKVKVDAPRVRALSVEKQVRKVEVRIDV